MCPEIYDNSLSPLCHLGQPLLLPHTLNTGRPKPFVLFAGKGKEGSSNNSFTTAVNNPQADHKRNKQKEFEVCSFDFGFRLNFMFGGLSIILRDEIYGQWANKPQWGDKIESAPVTDEWTGGEDIGFSLHSNVLLESNINTLDSKANVGWIEPPSATHNISPYINKLMNTQIE